VGFPGTECQNGDEKLGTLSQFKGEQARPPFRRCDSVHSTSLRPLTLAGMNKKHDREQSDVFYGIYACSYEK
jgi:hypothetical protein